MTVIPVDEVYRIVLDSHSWAIQKHILRNKEKDLWEWRPVAWFPKLEQCLEWLLDFRVRKSDTEGAASVVEAVRHAHADLKLAIERSPMANSWYDEKKRLNLVEEA